MTGLLHYRGWSLHLRVHHDTGTRECVIVSPYGVMTSATHGPDAVGGAKEVVDDIIDAHYPETPLGRYTPPTQFRPKPGQPRGLPYVCGRQRLAGEEARAACYGTGVRDTPT